MPSYLVKSRAGSEVVTSSLIVSDDEAAISYCGRFFGPAVVELTCGDRVVQSFRTSGPQLKCIVKGVEIAA